MRRILLIWGRPVLALITVVGVLFAAYTTANATTGSIHIAGTVTDQAGQAIQNVSVSATNPGSSTTVFGPAVTGSDGSYSLDVDPGTYDILFTPATGYTSLLSRNITVTGPRTLNSRLSSTSSNRIVSGTVTDPTGTAIANLGVILFSNSGTEVASAWTDATGHYSLTVPAGTYSYLKFRGFLTGYGQINGVDTPLADYGNPGDVDINTMTQDIAQDFALNFSKLTIVAKDSAGNAAPGAKVSYYYHNTDLGSTSVTSGETDYPFTVVSIAAGNNSPAIGANGIYTLLLPKGGNFVDDNSYVEPFCVTFTDGIKTCSTATVNASGDTSIEIDEPPIHTVSGVVSDNQGSPIANIGVEIFSDAGTEVRGTWTDANGNYSLLVPAQKYSYVKLHTFLGGSSQVNGTDLAYPDYGNAGDMEVDLTNSDVTKNLALGLIPLHVTAKDTSGNPATGANFSYNYQNDTFGNAEVTSNDDMHAFAVNGITISDHRVNISSSGDYTVLLPKGAVFKDTNSYVHPFCVTFASGAQSCDACTVDASSVSSLQMVFQEGQPVIAAPEVPTSLAAGITNQAVHLSWSAPCGATAYNVYRNGEKIGTTTDTSYEDTNVPEGDNSYYVTATNGPNESSPSTNATAVADVTAPTITYTISPTPTSAGWNNTDATVTFSCTDALSGIQSCSTPVTVSTEVAGQSVQGTAVDKAGNTSMVTAVVNVDKTAPTIHYSLSSAPNADGWYNSAVTVTFNCDDGLSGIDICPDPIVVQRQGSGLRPSGTAVDKAGNRASITTDAINMDQTAPNMSYSLSASPDANGQYTSDVTVTFQCNDFISGVKTCPAPITVVANSPSQLVTGTAVDYAGNTRSTSVQINHPDVTPPTISYSLSPAPNANSWNNADTTVTFQCSDAESGIATCTAPVTVSAESSDTTVVGTATDNAGNTKSVTAHVKLDKTVPTITYTLDKTPNANGWFKSDVTATFACADSLSGTTNCPAPVTYSTDGSNLISQLVTDKAGNVGAVRSSIKIDKTAPTITYSVSPSSNSAGWNNSNVTVTFSCSDANSGIQTCPAPATVSTEGNSNIVSGTAVDMAGNSTTVSVTIKLDKTVPTISGATMGNTLFFSSGTTNISANAADVLSGVATGEYYIDNDPGVGKGSAMTYAAGKVKATATIPGNLTPGQHKLYMRSKDNAGNWSAAVSVNFVFI
jgi:hypothetical protein